MLISNFVIVSNNQALQGRRDIGPGFQPGVKGYGSSAPLMRGTQSVLRIRGGFWKLGQPTQTEVMGYDHIAPDGALIFNIIIDPPQSPLVKGGS